MLSNSWSIFLIRLMRWVSVWYYFLLMLKRPDLQAREPVYLGDDHFKLHLCVGPWQTLCWYFDGSTRMVDLTQNVAALGFLSKLQLGPYGVGCLGVPHWRRKAKDVQKGVLFPLLYSWGLWATAGLSALPIVLLSSASLLFHAESPAGPWGFSLSQSHKELGLQQA